MVSRIVSSFESFQKNFSGILEADGKSERTLALKNYFKNGGVVSLGNSVQGWPKLIYPTQRRVEQQLKGLQDLRSIFLQKHRDWRQKHVAAKVYYVKNEVLKLSEPLYWKHLGKLFLDKDYKEDARSVKLPANLVADKRWKPMIKTFVNDIEYRKQLVETVQHSIVYEKNKEVGAFAKELQEFRQSVSTKKLVEIKKKLDLLDAEIKTLNVILKWATE